MKKVGLACCLSIFCLSLLPRTVMLKMGPYVGYYQPNDQMVKSIYGNGSSFYGARFGLTVWKLISLWGSYSQYRSTAQTTFEHENTTMALNPLTFSVRITAPLQFFILPYAALGYTFLDFKEESAIGRIQDTGNGPCVDAGMEIRFSSRLFLDLGLRYSSIKVQPKESTVSANLGGLQIGGSFVIAF